MSNPRNTIGFMLFFLVILLVAPFFIPGPGGKPIMSLARLKEQFFKSVPTLPEVATPLTPGASGDKVYKWQDEKGSWHFTNAPPAQGTARNLSEVNATVNRMPTAMSKESPPASGAKGAPAMNYSPEGIKQTIDQARRVQGEADKHNADLKKAVDDM